MNAAADDPSADSEAFATPVPEQPLGRTQQEPACVRATPKTCEVQWMNAAAYDPAADSEAFAAQVPEQAFGRTQQESDCVQATPETCEVTNAIQRDSTQVCPIASDPFDRVVIGAKSTARSSLAELIGWTRTLGSRVRRGSDTIDENVMNLVSFVGCEELLRGSQLSVILSKQAKIFSDSGGSAATYALSRATKFIDAFISHNWSVPRWQKWLCLVLQFNVRAAVLWTFVIMLPFCFLAVRGDLPTSQPEFSPYPRSYFFRLAMLPVFMILLFFYRDIKRCLTARFLSIPDPIVFLDKTCIHQEDKQIQRMGIEKLGAFLCYSRQMVICYTDVYLHKLWTVYEVASFMSLQPPERMTVVPVVFPIVFFSCLVFLYLGTTCAIWLELVIQFYYIAHFTIFIICYCTIVSLRKWSRSKRDILTKVANFDVRDCICFCEADRPVVYKNIAALMKVTSDIGDDAGEDVALAAFDCLVRADLATVLMSSVGKYGMQYEQAFAIACVLGVPKVFDQLVGVAHGMRWREFLNYTLWYMCMSGFIIPLVLTGFSLWADRCLGLTGWKEYVYLVLGLVVVYAPVLGTHAALDMLEQWANKSDLGETVFVLVFFILSALVRMLMNGPQCQQVCGKQAGRAETRRISMEDLDMEMRERADRMAQSVGKAAGHAEVLTKDLEPKPTRPDERRHMRAMRHEEI